VGTGDRVRAELDRRGLGDVGYCSNPEFLKEGVAIADFLRPDRVVVGDFRAADGDRVVALYEPLGAPILRTSVPTAEMIKYASNAFLATKISFINAMAEVCETAGADVTMLATAIGYDPRIGNRFLSAGLGFGGGCLPKDIRAFMARAGELGAEEALTFLREYKLALASRLATLVANVSTNASPLSGLGSPRLRMSTFDSRRLASELRVAKLISGVVRSRNNSWLSSMQPPSNHSRAWAYISVRLSAHRLELLALDPNHISLTL